MKGVEYINGSNYRALTREEAQAFVIYQLQEKEAHIRNIRRLRKNIADVCKIHKIEGIELSELFYEAKK